MHDRAYQLTRAMARGDTEALAQFYNAQFDRMYAEARRLTGQDESFCLDVVQDAMMRVIRSVTPIRGEAALRQWVRLVVRSAAYNRLRSEARRRRRETAYARRRTEESETDDRHFEGRLLWIRLQIAQMNVPEAQLLVLRYRLGWTLRRIGERMGLKPGAVDRRLRRVVARLQQQAKEQCDEYD